jgi:hypothetical protein
MELDINRALLLLRALRHEGAASAAVTYNDGGDTLRVTIQLTQDAPYGVQATVTRAGHAQVIQDLTDTLECRLRAHIAGENATHGIPEQCIVATLLDRSRWAIPARIIAEWRAAYFAERDAAGGDGRFIEVYVRELQIGLRDSGELLDYTHNSTNWRDVRPYARRLPDAPQAPADHERAWSNTHKEIVPAHAV